MKTIKIIDLLNKIANGEEVPETIRIGALDMYWDGDAYWDEDGETQFCEVIGSCEYGLNREVEITEEKDIEVLAIIENGKNNFCLINELGTYCSMNQHTRLIANKLNEVIIALNELKKEK